MIGGESFCTKHTSKPLFTHITALLRGSFKEAKAQMVEALCAMDGIQFVPDLPASLQAQQKTTLVGGTMSSTPGDDGTKEALQV